LGYVVQPYIHFLQDLLAGIYYSQTGDKQEQFSMPTIALIAHDGKKDDMIHFTSTYRALLSEFHLIATGTTGARVEQATGLPVERMLSGPYGGDAQIAARVAEGDVVGVIFLVDPLYAHPHEPDIQGLLRICNVYNIPLATNEASACLVLKGLATGAEAASKATVETIAQGSAAR
jgi:methylglyoxal synthase